MLDHAHRIAGGLRWLAQSVLEAGESIYQRRYAAREAGAVAQRTRGQAAAIGRQIDHSEAAHQSRGDRYRRDRAAPG